MKFQLFLAAVFASLFSLGCAPSAHDYFQNGTVNLKNYNCQSSNDFKVAADIELKDEGGWYPIYMMSLGQSRYYCGDMEGAKKAFMAIENYATLRSNRDVATKTFELLKSKGNRVYELTEREETFLHYYMGMIEYRLGNYQDAMIEFKKVDYIAEGTYSKLPIIALMRGLTYEKLGDKGNAFVAYKKVYEQNPTSPVGYMLCYRLEDSPDNKVFWKTEAKKRFNIDLDQISPNAKEIITILEFSRFPAKEYKIQLINDNFTSNAYIFDAMKPDFNFGDFAMDYLKEVGSKYARDGVKNMAANIIPGGGLIAGLILGGDDEEKRSWSILPSVIVVDVLYEKSSNFEVNIQYYANEKVVKQRKVVLDATGSNLVTTNF